MRDVHVHDIIDRASFSPIVNKLTFMKSFVPLEAVKNRSLLFLSLDLVRHVSGSSMMFLKL